jgi:hypothetical protein
MSQVKPEPKRTTEQLERLAAAAIPATDMISAGEVVWFVGRAPFAIDEVAIEVSADAVIQAAAAIALQALAAARAITLADSRAIHTPD